MQDPIGVREFLSTLWGDAEGVAELTYISGPVISHGFTYPSSLDAILTSVENHNGKTNCYFGVCIRKPGTRIGFFDGKGHRGNELAALSAACVWADIDFKLVPGGEDEVRKILKEFPLKPSVVVRSGGGVHVYWLLREAATGDELWRVKAVNKSLHGLLKVDRQSVDLARVLRVPETMNVKYTPPRPCEVSWWKPELRYSLGDFEELLAVEIEKPAVAPAHGSVREIPSADLPEDVRRKIETLLKDLWIDGVRHRMALYIAGIFAHAGFSEATAKLVVTNVSDANHGETPKRLKDVEDTYQKFIAEKKVAGAGLLEKMVKEEFPPLLAPSATKIYAEVLKHVRKNAPRGKKTNFVVDGLIKFDSRPAKWRVIIRMEDGTTINVDTPDTNSLMGFKLFQLVATEQCNVVLMTDSRRWPTMVAKAMEHTEIQPAPEEASPSGALSLTLNEFLEDRREVADHGTLKAFPGYDEQEIYFRLDALKVFMKERGMKMDDSDLFQLLRMHGWSSGVKRFGTKVIRIWSKAYENGTAHLRPVKPSNAQLELPTPAIQPEGSNEF